ncbi:MAG: glycoside hydrolase family 18 protein [Oscillospiraceae bacterium]|nr:glycoside hydrolase family 18 protein [Oscillospiraceae bacterium]
MKKLTKSFHSPTGSYIFCALAALACAFWDSAKHFDYLSDLYPRGFVPILTAVIFACNAVCFAYLLATSLGEKAREKTLLRELHTLFCIVIGVTVIYSAVVVFGLDNGIDMEGIRTGLYLVSPKLPYLGVALALPLPFLLIEEKKRKFGGALAVLLIAAVAITPSLLLNRTTTSWNGDKLPQMTFQSPNLMEGATLTFESLVRGEKPDAANILEEGGKAWTAQSPNRQPAENQEDVNNAAAEFQLARVSTFNTAVIEEIGDDVQYFRLQAYVNEAWQTVYQSEKIEAMRLLSFDPVTTDKVRLSIDKFRYDDKPAAIRSLRLYNEPTRDTTDFEVTAYQRLDRDVPTQILAKGEGYVKNYARFYDVYTTVIIFAATHWDEEGNLGFGELGEEGFAREIAALREIIAQRSNQSHQVKLIVTALADGAWGGGHTSVNYYMAKYWENAADKIVEFCEKYQFDGVDIDWEYPQNANDWAIYNKFITRLDDGLHENNPDAILTGALSAWALGMSPEVLQRFDQIQFMAYDGNDRDGFQSSLQQAQEGLNNFIANGADISKINIGIAAYGRPLNGTPFWAEWRNLDTANYWDSKYYNVQDGEQIYDGTFCAPALAGDKTAYALFSGAGGVMVFRVACDKTMDDPNSVARGIENALKRYAPDW